MKKVLFMTSIIGSISFSIHFFKVNQNNGSPSKINIVPFLNDKIVFLNPEEDYEKILSLPILNNKKVNKAIEFMTQFEPEFKVASIIKNNKNFVTYYLVRIHEYCKDCENNFLANDQFLINISNDYRYISSIKVYDNFLTDNQDSVDFINGVHNLVWSEIINDTIVTKEIVEFSNTNHPESDSVIRQKLIVNYFIMDEKGLFFNIKKIEHWKN